MNLVLRKEDRHIVDLLLDRSVRAAENADGKGASFFASVDPMLGQRIMRTQRLLRLLELLPETEPPADLVMRTLQYVRRYSQGQDAVRGQLPDIGSGQQPHA